MNKIIYDKIFDDIFERSYKYNFNFLNNSGYSSHEFNYRFAKSNDAKYKNYFIVVSRILEYQNMSITNNSYKVYIYDLKGNYVNDNELYKTAKGSFFKNLEYQ
jgi:hypothetical protein